MVVRAFQMGTFTPVEAIPGKDKFESFDSGRLLLYIYTETCFINEFLPPFHCPKYVFEKRPKFHQIAFETIRKYEVN